MAEIGVDMSRFSTDSHLISWVGYALGMTRAPASGDPIACARARHGSRPRSFKAPAPAMRKKRGYFQAEFHRLRARRVSIFC